MSAHEMSAGTASPAPRRRRRLGVELGVILVVSALLLAALGVGGTLAYRHLYSATAFVSDYLQLLASGRAADALAVPGVAVDSVDLSDHGLPPTASDALLRSAALTGISDVEAVSETVEGDATEVVMSFTVAGIPGSASFRVEQDGWIGVAPSWRFAESPLAVIDVTLRGSDTFAVNGFALDRRQVSSEGEQAAPLDPLPLLVFSPGLYEVTVDTAIADAPAVKVLADKPLADIPLDIQAQPTEKFVAAVQDEVNAFLDGCAAQQILQPTGCPFGFFIRNRIDDLPTWSIVQYPEVSIIPDGHAWAVPTTSGIAHIDVDVRLLFDGSLREVREDVPFELNAQISVLPDGSVSIQVGSPVP